MAGRRHVVGAVGRKSHDGDGPGITLGGAALHRRTSSEATPTTTSSPSSTPTATPARTPHLLTTTSSSKERDLPFDISRLPFFGSDRDRDRDRDHHHHRDHHYHHHHHHQHPHRDRDKGANLTVGLLSDMPTRSTSPIPPSVGGSFLTTSGTLVPSSTSSSGALSSATASKLHNSPSKNASSNTLTSSRSGTTAYDAKFVALEMFRHGTLGHPVQLPGTASTFGGSANAGATSLTSASALALPSTAMSNVTTSTSGMSISHGHSGGSSASDGSVWAQLHVHVLPLFNNQLLQSPIEDLNVLVRRHIESVLSRGPPKALAALEMDAADLINSGMTTLNAKLAGVEDEKLIGHVVRIWCFFWDQVLPYVEGVLLPLQTDSLLLQLVRSQKPARAPSPTNESPSMPHHPSSSSSLINTSSSGNVTLPGGAIDVRTLALRAFRDKVVLPVAPVLEAQLLNSYKFERGRSGPPMAMDSAAGAAVGEVYQQPRLQQMLLVLHSQAQRVRTGASLAFAPPRLDPPEYAMRRLLDALFPQRNAGYGYLGADLRKGKGNGRRLESRSKSPFGMSSTMSETHAPTFQSSGAPRDRRGRVAVKNKSLSETGHGYASASGELDDNLSLPPLSPTMATTEFGAANLRTGYHESDSSGALRRYHHLADEDDYFADGGGSTPRGRFSAERQRERSQSGHEPGDECSDDEPPEPPARTRTNGYQEQNVVDYRNAAVFEDGDEGAVADDRERNESLDSDWDRAQAVVERMVGMRSRSPAHGSEEFVIGGTPTHSVSTQSFRRRRMT